MIALVRLYQLTLGPFMGGQCRFYPTCSQYAIDALQMKPAWKALPMIAWRIVRCQPLCKCGFDPIPSSPEDEWYRIRLSRPHEREPLAEADKHEH